MRRQPLASVASERGQAQSVDVYRCGRFAAIHDRRASILRDMSLRFRVLTFSGLFTRAWIAARSSQLSRRSQRHVGCG